MRKSSPAGGPNPPRAVAAFGWQVRQWAKDWADRFAAWRRRRAALGARGERAAWWYLWWRGYQLVAFRHRSRWGELDLVAARRGVLVFVEVKTRRSDRWEPPAAAVTEQKQRRLLRAATMFLKQHRLLDRCHIRFDVISIVWPKGHWRPRIQHIQYAFTA